MQIQMNMVVFKEGNPVGLLSCVVQEENYPNDVGHWVHILCNLSVAMKPYGRNIGFHLKCVSRPS